VDAPILRTLLSHWRASVPILLVAVLAGSLVQLRHQPEYVAAGAMLLAPPELSPARSPETVVDIDELVERFETAAADRDGEARARLMDRTTLELTSRTTNAVSTEWSLREAVDWFEDEVAAQQESADVPQRDRLSWRMLTPELRANQQEDGHYVAQAIMWLEGLTGSEENPYVAGGQTAQILRITMTSGEGESLVRELIGPDIDYAIGRPDSRRLPLMPVSTQGRDADSVIAAFDLLIEATEDELNARQARAGVPVSRRVTLDVIVRPMRPESTEEGLSTKTLGTLALGVLLAIAATGLLEVRRRGAESVKAPLAATPTGIVSRRNEPMQAGRRRR
jgi:hypothetical protein